jgi:hypothetical protein
MVSDDTLKDSRVGDHNVGQRARLMNINGDSYRLADAKRRRAKQDKPAPKTANEP